MGEAEAVEAKGGPAGEEEGRAGKDGGCLFDGGGGGVRGGPDPRSQPRDLGHPVCKASEMGHLPKYNIPGNAKRDRAYNPGPGTKFA